MSYFLHEHRISMKVSGFTACSLVMAEGESVSKSSDSRCNRAVQPYSLLHRQHHFLVVESCLSRQLLSKHFVRCYLIGNGSVSNLCVDWLDFTNPVINEQLIRGVGS